MTRTLIIGGERTYVISSPFLAARTSIGRSVRVVVRRSGVRCVGLAGRAGGICRLRLAWGCVVLRVVRGNAVPNCGPRRRRINVALWMALGVEIGRVTGASWRVWFVISARRVFYQR